MSSATNAAIQPKCRAPASASGTDLTGTLEPRADRRRDLARGDALLVDRVETLAGPALLDRQPVEPDHVGDMRRRPAVAALADIGRRRPSRARSSRRARPGPAAASSCTCGSRITDHLDAGGRQFRARGSEAMRGLGCSRLNTSSVASCPGAGAPMPVPEVMTQRLVASRPAPRPSPGSRARPFRSWRRSWRNRDRRRSG